MTSLFIDALQWLYSHWTYLGDGTAIGVMVGTIADLLPPIAAGIAIVYWALRIYETDTVQGLIFKWKKRNGYDQ